MTKIGVYNEDGEPIGFEYVYEDVPDPAEPEYDEIDEDEKTCSDCGALGQNVELVVVNEDGQLMCWSCVDESRLSYEDRCRL